MSCPICGKPAAGGYRPFCSRRCADLDLARWLRGDYRIPGEPAEGIPVTPFPDPDDLDGNDR